MTLGSKVMGNRGIDRRDRAEDGPACRPTSLPVPRIDVAPLVAGEWNSSAAHDARAQMRKACAEIGFMTIVGHGIPRARTAALSGAANDFFALPDAEKFEVSPRRWWPDSPNVYRGYFPSTVAGKEGLDIGDPELREPALLSRPYHERNLLPSALGPSWAEAVSDAFAALSALAATLLGGLVAALGGDAQRVPAAFARPAALSTLRFNFYPERQEPVALARDDGTPLCCEAHVDSGLLTVLHQDEVGGLQVRDGEGRWRTIAPDPKALVVNTGLALQRMTRGELVATTHRVLHSRRQRLSIPFFHEPVPDFVMSPASLGLPHRPPEDPPCYEDFLRRSLGKFSEYAR